MELPKRRVHRVDSITMRDTYDRIAIHISADIREAVTRSALTVVFKQIF
jgi:hypothetical protein